jgi:hypothetical protein
LALPARLDAAATEQVRAQLSLALERATPRIHLDFSAVCECSASALALLATLVRETARADRPPGLAVGGVAGPIAALLRVTGLDRAWSSSG